VYAATKAHQEHLGTAIAGATGSDVVSLRYHNVYGPRMPRDTPYAGVASIFRSSCEAHRPPHVFEDGRQRRDFIHVTDVANANMLALTAPGTIGGAYNIATGQVCTISELAEYVCDGVDPTAPRPVITGQYQASTGPATSGTSTPPPNSPKKHSDSSPPASNTTTDSPRSPRPATRIPENPKAPSPIKTMERELATTSATRAC
jgi:nucleoside-diphosphate-sugar epimerase